MGSIAIVTTDFDSPRKVSIFTPLLSIVVTSLFVCSIHSDWVRWLFPLLSVSSAYRLYRNRSETYVPYVLWLWFLTPCVRRLVDLQIGWMDPNPILLAPPLASLVCIASLVENRTALTRSKAKPFLLCLASVFYGIAIGCLNVAPSSLFVEALNWLAPIVFGFHIYALRNREGSSDAMDRAIASTFCWGAIVMSVYGICQFIAPSASDSFWMTQSNMTSIGLPEPFQIRVFSTMNSPGPFAIVLAGGLIYAAAMKQRIFLLCGTAASIALALTSVRSAWLAVLTGLCLLALANKRSAVKLSWTVLVMVGSLFLLSTWQPAQEVMEARVQTFTNLQSDSSYLDRSQGFSEMVHRIVRHPIGEGIGIANQDQQLQDIGAHDNAILELLISLGWLGGSTYMLGALLACFRALISRNNRSFIATCAGCVSLGIVAQCPLGSSMLGAAGIVLWVSIAVSTQREKPLQGRIAPSSEKRVSERIEHVTVCYEEVRQVKDLVLAEV